MKIYMKKTSYEKIIGARLMVKLTSIEPIFKEIKSVREFTFKK